MSLSSYNKFKNNVFKDTLIVCITNCLTSLFAGFAIFTIVGNMAKNLGKPVNEVVDSGMIQNVWIYVIIIVSANNHIV